MVSLELDGVKTYNILGLLMIYVIEFEGVVCVSIRRDMDGWRRALQSVSSVLGTRPVVINCIKKYEVNYPYVEGEISTS